ncbi:hypothetical protein [Mesorhizobium sp. AaZ16]|uniref:hypothetical protein n=1 Tax=Mesorhizobium sp. AaZ16 TaxID=3402289 RepID=UPI00374EAB8A
MTEFATSRIGLFWFITLGRGLGRFASASLPWSAVEEIGGFKTYDKGHIDVWPEIQRRDTTLRNFEYEHFPRGRVNWRCEDDAWLLLLDPKLNDRAFIDHIVKQWNLPQKRLRVFEDSHYRIDG